MKINPQSHVLASLSTQLTAELTRLFQLPGSYHVACGQAHNRSGTHAQQQFARSWTVNQPREGKASIKLGDQYTLEFDEKSSNIRLRNNYNKESSDLWGENSLAQTTDGQHGSAIEDNITYRLDDGTKITIASHKANDGVISPDKIIITKNGQCIQVSGLGNNVAGDMEIQQSDIGGQIMDWATRDGRLVDRSSGKLESGCWTPRASEGDNHQSFDSSFSNLLALFLNTGLVVESDTSQTNATETTVTSSNSDDVIEVSQRDDGGLDVTTNGETIQLTTDESQNVTIQSGSGDDHIIIDDNVTTEIEIQGGDGDDRIEITHTDDAVTNGDENLSNLLIKGEAGDDQIIVDGTNYNIEIEGGAGDDVIAVNQEADTDTTSNDNSSSIVIRGESGDDSISITESQNTNIEIAGGAGDDDIHLSTASDSIDTSQDSSQPEMNSILVQGDGGNDQISIEENSQSNLEIEGGSGDDHINISGQADPVTGSGDDNHTTATISGDSGDDQIIVDQESLIDITADGGDGDDIVIGGAGDDNISGGTGNDILLGGDGSEVIDAGAGNDIILGQGDTDIIHGGDGNDVLDGGNDNDIITAGIGIDSVNGGDGVDALILSDNSELDIETARALLSDEDTEALNLLENTLNEFDASQIASDYINFATRTEPNQGVHTSDIEAIVFNTQLEQHPWNVELIETVYFLHLDGWAYQGLDIPPSDFNVEISRQLENDKWTEWRESDTGYELLNQATNDWESLSGSVLTNTSVESGTIHGDYSRLFANSNIIMDSISTNRLRISLTEDMQFVTSSSQMFTGGSSDTFLSSVISESDNGTSSTFNGTGGGAYVGSHRENENSGAENSGNYSIDGFTIEFSHDSGRVSRELFFMRGDDIFIGNMMYYV